MGDGSQVGAPDFGCLVLRERLLHVFNSTAPDITLITAPGGYGKSVFAAQLAADCGGECVWIAVNGCSPSVEDLPSTVAGRIHHDRGLATHTASAVPAATMATGWSSLETALRDCTTSPPVMVVVDGFDRLATTEFAHSLSSLTKRLFGSRVRLVVTCRQIQKYYEPATHDSSSWLVARSALEFGREEVVQLAERVLSRSLEPNESEALCRSSTGQPALLILLLRHLALSRDDLLESLNRAPADVADYLERSITVDMGMDVLAVLGVASILGSGTVAQLVAKSRTSLSSVMAAAEAVPLLRVTGRVANQSEYVLHDLACEVYRRSAFDRWWGESDPYLSAAVEELANRGDYHRLFCVLIDSNHPSLLVAWTERLGFELLEDAHLGLLDKVLGCIPMETQACSPRLLLVGALVKRSRGELSEAMLRVDLARGLVETDPDTALERDCLIVEARLRWDTAEYGVILPRLVRAYDVALAQKDYDTAVLMGGYLASAHAIQGDVRLGREHALQHAVLARCHGVRPSTRAQALQAALFVLGIVCGDIATSIDLLREVMRGPVCPTGLDIQCEANLAALLVETGRLCEASRLTSSVRARVAECGLRLLADACVGTDAAVHAGWGDYASAERLMTEAIELATCAEDQLSRDYNRVYRSTIHRAAGRHDDALADAEDALAAFTESGGSLPIMACLARCEVAASFLALGDCSRAGRLALESRTLAEAWTASYHLLRADMILAEVERRSGDVDVSIARIRTHADYILTESGNWQIAMYIRAFPGLLAVFAKAVGVDALPGHMLRMVVPAYASPALDSCAGILTPDELERLATRLLGSGAAAYVGRLDATPTVRVRLFGGMQVDTPHGRVSDKDWRKRKARLLFAIIVLQRGKDLSREQLFEHLWPEMTEERAKSNFYVIWSIMRRVLIGNASGGPCPFVEHQGGVCRIVPGVVKSDVADFEDALVAMRRADRAGDSELACAAADEVAQYYRGELLPGELYDDWLSPIRDRYRHDYGDAMLRAAQLHHEAGDTEKALHMVRAALSQDPWREDLYQAALRYQIYCGQRSGAIETYTACRSRLAEDLGLDPSVETRRLYDEILAMEDGPTADTT